LTECSSRNLYYKRTRRIEFSSPLEHGTWFRDLAMQRFPSFACYQLGKINIFNPWESRISKSPSQVHSVLIHTHLNGGSEENLKMNVPAAANVLGTLGAV
jgi:hypothetical protein